MKNNIKILLSLVALLPFFANAGANLTKLSAKNEGKKIAIVSLSANNYSKSLQGWNSADTTELMASRLNKMLELAETKFSGTWSVIPASSFVSNSDYQLLAGEKREVGLPVINGKSMPLMSENRKELVKARLKKEKASELCKITGADFVAVIYSEWAVKTGRFVPTSKALAKNVVSVYNAKGKQVYSGRSDKIGNKTLGAVGRVAVNAGTIDEWVVAYEKGLNALYPVKK